MSLDSAKIEERIRSWKGFQEVLRSDDKDLFKSMMSLVYKYAPSIQAMPKYDQELALLLSLVFDQHKAIQWLKKQNECLKMKAGLT